MFYSLGLLKMTLIKNFEKLLILSNLIKVKIIKRALKEDQHQDSTFLVTKKIKVKI